MKKLNLLLIIVALVAFAYAPAAAITYTGSLSTPDGIVGSGSWASDFSITWNITSMNNGNDYWHYEYTFEMAKHATSHMILEVSANATMRDFFNITGVTTGDPQWYGPAPSNPGIPGSIFGIKFDYGGESPFTYSFDSYKTPTWGDFYTKDGVTGDVFNYAYNTDFLMADPVAPAQSGLLSNGQGGYIYKILRPDTVSTIPEPSTLILLGTALIGGGVVRRFRRK